MSDVAYLPGAAQPLLSKKQLAAYLQRSNRWIELRVREGMPRTAPTPRFPRARYNLADVEAWLADGQRPKHAPTNDRLAALERTVAELRSELDELKAPGVA